MQRRVCHLFLSCFCFGSLWPLVRSWFGFDDVYHQEISDHFIQFTHYTRWFEIAEVLSSAYLAADCLDFMEGNKY